MANTYKAHKSNAKYSFQRGNKGRTWLIAIAAALVVIVIGVVVYNNSRQGEIKVAAPAEASLNNIAENWSVLASYTDKVTAYPFTNSDGSESVTLQYTGSEDVEIVMVYINPELTEPIENEGIYVLPSIFTTELDQLSAGAVSLDDVTVVLRAGNENCVVYLEDYQAAARDDSALNTVIAELEALIAAGPVVTETAEDAPATEDAPAAE